MQRFVSITTLALVLGVYATDCASSDSSVPQQGQAEVAQQSQPEVTQQEKAKAEKKAKKEKKTKKSKAKVSQRFKEVEKSKMSEQEKLAAYNQYRDDDDMLVCTRDVVTGSHFRRSNCRTVAERRAEREAAQKALDDFQHSSVTGPDDI